MLYPFPCSLLDLLHATHTHTAPILIHTRTHKTRTGKFGCKCSNSGTRTHTHKITALSAIVIRAHRDSRLVDTNRLGRPQRERRRDRPECTHTQNATQGGAGMGLFWFRGSQTESDGKNNTRTLHKTSNGSHFGSLELYVTPKVIESLRTPRRDLLDQRQIRNRINSCRHKTPWEHLV